MAELTPRNAALADALDASLGALLKPAPFFAGQLSYHVEPGQLLEACQALRDQEPFRFEMLMDLCGVDYLAYGRTEWQTATATDQGFSRGVLRSGASSAPAPMVDVDYEPAGRFAVVYHLLSVTHNQRLRLKVFATDDEAPIIDSVAEIWASAGWYEREAFDLYGILFRGHPDLRRLLTDYGFIGHPFRKDFPLSGNVEMRYDPEKGRVVYEPVSIEPRTLVPKVIREDNRYEQDLRDPDV